VSARQLAETCTVFVANPSADLYGSDRMMLESVVGLKARGWRVVVTCSVEGPLLRSLDAAGIEARVQSVPVVRKSILSARGLLGVARQLMADFPAMLQLLRRVRPTIMLVNTVTIPLWLVAARWCRIPAVVHVHEAEGSLAKPARLALSAPLALATSVVFNSEVSRRVSGLKSVERRDRFRVIPNGVRGPTDPSIGRSELGPPFRVVFVGRLSPRKGVDLAIRAIHELIKHGMDTELDLVGSVFPGYEWYETELHNLVRSLGLSKRIRFHGFQESVWPFLGKADVAVMPSQLDESFGNAMIESLLACRPVVASDHTGLREAANGFQAVVLIPTDDYSALASALRKIHDSWDRYRRNASADALTARELYSPDRFSTALSQHLYQVVTFGRSHSSRAQVLGTKRD
jgi:glycosyltransferase involved in cell wall biosynthesis